MPKYKCILFDLDETLCYFTYTKEIIETRINVVLHQSDINKQSFWSSYRVLEQQLIFDYFHNVIDDEQFCQKGPFAVLQNLTANAQSISKIISDILLKSFVSVKLFDDVVEYLKFLRNHNCDIALLTNGTSNSQRTKLTTTHLDSYFNNIYISEEVGYAKPDKRFFEYALNDLNIESYDAVFLGNSLSDDCAGAKSSGIDFVLMDRYNNHKDYIGNRVKCLAEFMPNIL